jgi:hypothetical protein
MSNEQDELSTHSECETCSAKVCSCDDAPCAGRVVEAPSPMRGIHCCVECVADWEEAARHEAAERRAGFVVEMAASDTRKAA